MIVMSSLLRPKSAFDVSSCVGMALLEGLEVVIAASEELLDG